MSRTRASTGVWIFLACAVAGLAGCKLGRPNWWNPGSAPAQQYRATIYDPYADNDAGPEMVGARPREFVKPRPEAVRSLPPRDQNAFWGYPGAGVVAPPSAGPVAPPTAPPAPVPFPHQ